MIYVRTNHDVAKYSGYEAMKSSVLSALIDLYSFLKLASKLYNELQVEQLLKLTLLE